MEVLTHTGGVAMTNAFVVIDDDTGLCVLVDAPDHTAGPLVREATERGFEFEGLWLTHGHFDHVADHALLANVPVVMHELDAPKLRDPMGQLRAFGERTGFGVPLTIEPREPDWFVSEGDELKVGGLVATVLHTPGHSPGHVAFYFEQEKLLIGGDLIIGGSVGRTDLPDSDHAQLEASVRRIMELPDDTRLLGGHGAATTIGQEREQNAAVQMILRS
jgi:glyoxylase-like metal-dependent hydrolase (beta-lactamase superfamily II)